MAIRIINGDAATLNASADLIFTDPPFDLSGKALAQILGRYTAPHIVLITSMRQALEFIVMLGNEWTLGFDFVLDAVVPKHSKSKHQPHYTHATGLYLRRESSVFNRKLRPRSDTFDGKGYWPTILRAPRQQMQEHGQAKNEQAVLDLLGSFAVRSVIDPFAGSFTTALAAAELDIDCVAIERDAQRCQRAYELLRFMGAELEDRHAQQ